jgi:hypothetical protein
MGAVALFDEELDRWSSFFDMQSVRQRILKVD